MKYLLSLIIGGALVVSGFGQTRNVLVGTNNAVVQPTNFWSADAVNARSGLGLGSAATNLASAFQPSSLTLSNLASSNGVNLTNLISTNIVGVLSIAQGGTGATNAADARTAFGLDTAATNPASAFQPSSAVLSNLATSNGANLTNIAASNIVGAVAVVNGGTGATNAATARTNLGATTIGNALFTATNSSAAIDAIGISTNFSDQVLSVSNITIGSFTAGSGRGFVVPTSGKTLQVAGTNVSTTVPAFYGFNGFESTAFSDATARTNLGLNAWTTNTNSPVFVGTNGEVVGPTNFWQVAPIVTRFVEFDPATNATTNIVAARNLHIHSLAISRTGVTSTIALPTNGAFNGDIALVVHQGPTSSVTAVRTAGAGTNLVTLNQFDEAVEFVYYNNVWQFNHNLSFIEPIYFSGTNAAANAEASRTNLGLGTTNDVTFNSVIFGNDTTNNTVTLVDNLGFFLESDQTNTGAAAINFQGDASSKMAANTRINLGIPLPALTNTNNANFRTAIELGATNNVSFSNVTASGTLTATSTVTAKTNLVVEGFVDYTAARTNNTPTNTPNFAAHAAWIEVKVGTNSFFLPAYQ